MFIREKRLRWPFWLKCNDTSWSSFSCFIKRPWKRFFTVFIVCPTVSCSLLQDIQYTRLLLVQSKFLLVVYICPVVLELIFSVLFKEGHYLHFGLSHFFLIRGVSEGHSLQGPVSVVLLLLGCHTDFWAILSFLQGF